MVCRFLLGQVRPVLKFENPVHLRIKTKKKTSPSTHENKKDQLQSRRILVIFAPDDSKVRDGREKTSGEWFERQRGVPHGKRQM